MATRGSRPALLLTLVLLAASLALSRGETRNLLNNIFNQHHVDNPKTPASDDNAYCDMMMWNRSIYWKLVNTFIHKPKKNINKVCSLGGTPILGDLRRSNAVFPTTQCTYNPLTWSFQGRPISKQIVITCWNRLPATYLE
ncbi:ribonuclease-like [Emydura macquarii macquarii]|uniref:ribonuclease-like n=1 Tax=Emydura macquarii macquarii TaxID=1129001 RepID=UPI00352AD21A